MIASYNTATSLLLLLTCGLVQQAHAQNASATTVCPTVDPTVDAFPIKVEATASSNWTIDYFNTYKVVTNIAANETYLLYQCGSEMPTEPPASGIPYTASIEIPVQNIGIEVTVSIPFLEQLGLVDQIVAFTSDPNYISSPCFLDAIEQGDVLVALPAEAVDGAPAATSNVSAADTFEQAVAFISPFGEQDLFDTAVKVSEYTEKTNAAIFEWIKFYSAFFNLEDKANQVFNLTQQRWQCVADQANLATADAPAKPVVLWAYYSDYCQGWDAGECPNYYCEYATQCSATLLGSTEGNFSEACGAKYLSTAQIVELGATADHWIYPSDDWNTTYNLFKDQLDTMKAVQDKQVFDVQASGSNAWFEQRFPEYFAVLQDFCSIVGTTTSFAGKSWFRNVMDGTPVGSVGTECTVNSRANSIVPVVGAVCANVEATAVEEVVPTTNWTLGFTPTTNSTLGTTNSTPGTTNSTPGTTNSTLETPSTNTTLACPTVDPTVDAFPVKVEAIASSNWTIEYFNTYKVLTNVAANETYLLYLCGSDMPTEPPASGIPYTTIIEIPVKNIGIEYTVAIPFLEQLGLVDQIVAFTSDPVFISSPCLLDSIEEGNVLVALPAEAVDGAPVAASNTSAVETFEQAVVFYGGFGEQDLFEKAVVVSEYTEKSNAAVFEWIKFYSVFFNLEAKANEVYDVTQQRWQCVADQANLATADAPAKPVVLWAYYSDFCQGWDAGECPNYYCEYAAQCSAELLGSTNGTYSEACESNFLSTEQLVELGATADYWIYASNNWNETYPKYKDQLDTMKAVQDGQVFDWQGSGTNAWFEQRYAEYFAVLQDFCSIVGTTTSFAGKSWFRNVMDGTPVGSVGTECTVNSRSNSIVPVAGAVCADVEATAIEEATPVTAPTVNVTPAVTSAAPVAATATSAAPVATPTATAAGTTDSSSGTAAGLALLHGTIAMLVPVLVGLV